MPPYAIYGDKDVLMAVRKTKPSEKEFPSGEYTIKYVSKREATRLGKILADD